MIDKVNPESPRFKGFPQKRQLAPPFRRWGLRFAQQWFKGFPQKRRDFASLSNGSRVTEFQSFRVSEFQIVETRCLASLTIREFYRNVSKPRVGG